MIKWSDEDLELDKKCEAWYTFNENKEYVLRDDAPEEIKKIDAMLKKKYYINDWDW